MKIAKIAGVILVSSLSATSSFSYTKPIVSFDQLLTALNAGHTVRAVVNYDKCMLNVDSKSTPKGQAGRGSEVGMIGSFNFNDFSYDAIEPMLLNQPVKYVITAKRSLWTETDNFYTAPEFSRIQIYSDNSAEVYVGAYKSAHASFNRFYSESYTCQVSNGNDGNAITLFDKG